MRALIVLISLSMACGDEGTVARPAESSADQIIAVHVNDVPIPVEDVVRQMQVNEQSARAAIDALVDEALLAQHAQGLGFGDLERNELEFRRLAVHTLMSRVVEGEVTPESLDPEVLEREARSVADARVRPGDRWCDLFRIGRDEEGALEEAEAVRVRWGSEDAGETVVPESLSVGSVERNVPYDPSNSGDAVVRAVYELNAIGDVTDTLRSGGDFVVAKLVRLEPDGELGVDDVREEVRDMYLNHERTQRLLRLVQEAESRFRVVRNEELIDSTVAELSIESAEQ